jgi:hypothetical protein
MAPRTATQKVSSNQKPFQEKGPARPAGSNELEPGQISTEACHVIAHKHGWTLATYKNEDGSSGAVMTNGQSAIHFDANNRIIIATGEPAQGGCGGQVVINAADRLETSKTQTIHITGNANEERVKGKDGQEEIKKRPAYSLMVEGDIAIEGRGEVSIGGDNVTIVSKNVLTLKGTEINLIAGDGGGKVNIHAADVSKNVAFEKNVTTGGSHSEVTGEFTVNQKANPGAVTAINTLGGMNLVVRGDYNISTLGQYQLNALGNILMSSTKGGFATISSGKYFSWTGGVKEENIMGKSISASSSKPLTTYSLKLGPNETGLQLNSTGAIKMQAIGSGATITAPTGINLFGGQKITAVAAAIFLN